MSPSRKISSLPEYYILHYACKKYTTFTEENFKFLDLKVGPLGRC